jgi:hypothetical protein
MPSNVACGQELVIVESHNLLHFIHNSLTSGSRLTINRTGIRDPFRSVLAGPAATLISKISWFSADCGLLIAATRHQRDASNWL